MAVACDDFSIHVIDTDTRRVVRVFAGHTNRISDMVRLSLSLFGFHFQYARDVGCCLLLQVFSPDSKWLVTGSMDCSIRTWDLATSR